MTTIIGVDFSGAKTDRNTWITEGTMDATGALILCKARSIRRIDLGKRLADISPPAIIGMDFPFGLPKRFAETEFNFKGTQMHEMWQVIDALPDLPKYIEEMAPRLKKGGDLRKFNKCLRHGDKTQFSGVAYSPLNPAGPAMFPMTFYGMKMLHGLWTSQSRRFIVPPLPENGRVGPVLLEIMPGALLRAYSLPHERYKSYRGEAQKLERMTNRKKILDGLTNVPVVSKETIGDLRSKCMDNHDCLDSVIAAVAAAMWVNHRTCCFCHPTAKDLSAAQQEGWIYSPSGKRLKP